MRVSLGKILTEDCHDSCVGSGGGVDFFDLVQQSCSHDNGTEVVPGSRVGGWQILCGDSFGQSLVP